MALPFAPQRARLRTWRSTRPLLAGILIVFGGVEVIALPMVMAATWSPVPIIVQIGWHAAAGIALGLVMIVGGLFVIVAPEQRVPVSVGTAAASIATLVAANLGGFVVGMMIGVIGSCLAFGWSPDKGTREQRDHTPSGRS